MNCDLRRETLRSLLLPCKTRVGKIWSEAGLGPNSILHSLQSDEISFLSSLTFLCPFPVFFSIPHHDPPHPALHWDRQEKFCRATLSLDKSAWHSGHSTGMWARRQPGTEGCTEMLRTQTTSLILQVCVSPTTTRNLQFLEAEIRIELIQEPWLGVRHQLKSIRLLGLMFLSFSQAISLGWRGQRSFFAEPKNDNRSGPKYKAKGNLLE